MPRAQGKEDPLLHRRRELRVRYYHKTTPALRLPRFICGRPTKPLSPSRAKNSKATESTITRTVSARPAANGNKHQRFRNCLPTINYTRLELLKAKKRRSSSSAASSSQGELRRSCVATGACC